MAFIESPDEYAGSVVVVDRRGKREVLADNFIKGYPSCLAWAPRGDEIWFGVNRTGMTQELWAVTLTRRQRPLYRAPVSTRLLDVSREGRVLVGVDVPVGRNFFRGRGEGADRELSWLDFSIATALSRDGRWILIAEEGGGVESADSVDLYLRETSGKPPMKLGRGFSIGEFSANGRIIAVKGYSPPGIVLYPIPSGSSETIPMPDIIISNVSGLLPPDDRVVVVTGKEPSHSDRIWLVGRDGTKHWPITPEGVTAMQPSAIPPDGTFILGTAGGSTEGKTLAYPVAGGEPRPLKGLRDGEEVAGWGADGHSLFAYDRLELPLKIYRVDDRTARARRSAKSARRMATGGLSAYGR